MDAHNQAVRAKPGTASLRRPALRKRFSNAYFVLSTRLQRLSRSGAQS